MINKLLIYPYFVSGFIYDSLFLNYPHLFRYFAEFLYCLFHFVAFKHFL